MPVDPLKWWKAEIGEVAPVGYALRPYLHSHWARFHSLAESKRYSECAVEYGELLSRHTKITDLLFTEAEPLFLYRSRFEETNEPKTVCGVPLSDASIVLPANPQTVSSEDDDHLIVRVASIQWRPAFFEALVRDVADATENFVVFVSPATRNIYAPYDGGLDTFSFSVFPESLKEQFATWMSSRADQL